MPHCVTIERARSLAAILAVLAIFLAPLASAPALGAQAAETRMISIDFDNVDIKLFIKFISKITGKNFVVDNKVKGNVTVISPKKISVAEAYQVFESVLEINGFATVKAGKVIKIVPVPQAKGDNIDTRITDGPEAAADRIVTRLIPLEYADSNELKGLLSPLFPKGSVILSYRDTNMLIVTATLASIERILKIITTIDVTNIGKKISIIPVAHADAEKMVKILSSVFKARLKGEKGKADASLMVYFTADDRTNSIIFLASKRETERVKEMIRVLDQELPRGDEKIRVYYLEHASAEDLAQVLQKIPTQNDKSGAGGKKETPILSQEVAVNADKATNSLIITAEKEDYPVLEDVIRKLDIPRAMVYIECLIMEVNMTRGLNIGTEWRTSQSFDSGEKVVFGGFGGTGDSGYTNTEAAASDGSLPQGFSLGVLGKTFSIGGVTFPDIRAVVEAFQSDKDVNILATPQLLTTENQEAIITVGKNVPYQTRSAAESSSETYSSYEYKDVGISLKITPQISKEGMVRLEVFQEMTKLDTVNQTSPDRPTTYKRQIQTTIIVEDGNSVVIGGLLDESESRTESKTPCLGDLPGVGWAFKTVNEGQEKTNLYVFLTPRLVRNTDEAGKIYQEKREAVAPLMEEAEINLYNTVDEMGKKLSGKGEKQAP